MNLLKYFSKKYKKNKQRKLTTLGRHWLNNGFFIYNYNHNKIDDEIRYYLWYKEQKNTIIFKVQIVPVCIIIFKNAITVTLTLPIAVLDTIRNA